VSQVIVLTGASSGFGALTARALADAGHNVYAGIRNTASRNADAVTQLSGYASSRHVELKSVEMDVSSKDSVDAAITSIVEEHGRLDVVVHNAGHMVTGPTEAFTPEDVADIYDTNVLGTQRVNRAALPHLPAQG
jgi:NAD(P)-dependent dehydrogenase (short-subunit alcohol dehydrogenase family)